MSTPQLPAPRAHQLLFILLSLLVLLVWVLYFRENLRPSGNVCMLILPLDISLSSLPHLVYSHSNLV